MNLDKTSTPSRAKGDVTRNPINVYQKFFIYLGGNSE